jgi:hypothetical protein
VGVTLHVCNPSYAGGISKRIEVRLAQVKKLEILSEKIAKRKKD